MNNNIRLVLISYLIGLAVGRPQGFFAPNALVYSASTTTPPPGPRNFIPILKYSADNTEDGNYQYAYETGNGISVNENGRLNPAAREGPAVTANGGFSFTGTDGQTYTITYIADDNGFRPVGAHIPTPPPIPEAIAKALQTLPKLESTNTGTQGQYQIIANRY